MILCFPHQGAHPLPVNIPGSDKMDDVRVGDIGESAGIHGSNDLAAIALQNGFVGGFPAAVAAKGFVSDKMLSQKQVFNTCFPEKIQGFGEVGRIEFCFQAGVNFQ